MNKNNRHQARVHALQAIYQWQITNMAASEIKADFIEGNHLHKGTDQEYFFELLTEVIAKHTLIDTNFKNFLKLSIEKLDPIELAILRIATFELTYKLEIPWKVILNEALELAKKFASITGYKFINGVLEQVAKNLRPEETQLP